MKAGGPMSWTPDEVRAGQLEVDPRTASRVAFDWDELGSTPGWCKLDWVVADPRPRRSPTPRTCST